MHEITRTICKQHESLTPHQIHSVYRCIGNFLNFMFKKQQYDTVMADIFCFGTVIRTQTTGVTEFVPSHVLQLETAILKAMPQV